MSLQVATSSLINHLGILASARVRIVSEPCLIKADLQRSHSLHYASAGKLRRLAKIDASNKRACRLDYSAALPRVPRELYCGLSRPAIAERLSSRDGLIEYMSGIGG